MADDAKGRPEDTEVRSRLDALFPDDAPSGPEGANSAGSTDAADPIEELRNLVMSIEWEITDEVMTRFVEQIDALKLRYGKDRILVMFLQLLGSLGLYVRTYKAQAHPNAFKLIHSVYKGFDKVMNTDGLSASDKKKLLYVELNKYKDLKDQIDQTKTAPQRQRRDVLPETVRTATEEVESTVEASSTVEGEEKASDEEPIVWESASATDILTAIEQFKATVLKELDGIRKEIQRLGSA